MSAGRPLRIHGRRPLEEAEAWLSSSLPPGDMPGSICVIGAGAGWVVDAIERRSVGTRVLVLEPEPQLAQAMLARRDWRPLIDAGRLLVLAGPHFQGADVAWRLVVPAAANPLRLVHPVIAAARPEASRAAGRVYGRAVADARANDEARGRLQHRYFCNTLANRSAIRASADVSALAGAFPGVPAVLLAAGPSLDRNLEALAGIRQRALVIAVDTALRPCLVAGLEPHLVVAVDPTEVNARHLVGLPPLPRTRLVTEPSLPPEVLEAFTGRLFTFRVGAHEPWPWLQQHRDRPRRRAGVGLGS